MRRALEFALALSLLGPAGERLPRLAGEFAYWFGRFAFFRKTELYGTSAAR